MPITYDEDKIKLRFHTLVQLYEGVVAPKFPETYLDKCILLHCVHSYFLDLERMKDFHHIALADVHKIAGYATKWITKLKPIQQLENSAASYTRRYQLVNEFYAMYFAFSVLKLHTKLRKLTEPFRSNLLYTFHYRDIDGSLLSTMMYTLECACARRNP